MSKTSYSDKKVVKELVDLCVANGLREVIISPGSRNAPLIITLTANEAIKCISIVDERSAAYFALGMAQQSGRPVGLVCTSGTALLNYGPALAEAYYQKVPLMVLSADRPAEWVDQGDGQTIRQEGVFSNFIKYSCNLPVEIHGSEDEWYLNRLVSEAFYHCVHEGAGPVHINVPMREPLYGRTVYPKKTSRVINHIKGHISLPTDILEDLAHRWNHFESIIILVGMREPDPQMASYLAVLSELENVVVLAETTSNISGAKVITTIDSVVSTVSEEEAALFRAGLLVSFNGGVISKRIKEFLRNNSPKEHWLIDRETHHLDTFQHLSTSIEAKPAVFFEQLIPLVAPKKSRFRDTWQRRTEQVGTQHNNFMEKVSWSDLQAFHIIMGQVGKGIKLQLGNSTPVRYAQFFGAKEGVECYSNRGTSGIDGCVSTAAGAAFESDNITLLLVGDLSFFYDSNGLWNNHLNGNLKIVVINNEGGGIFRFIQGPSGTEELETFFEAHQQRSCEHMAATFNIPYFSCSTKEGLEAILPEFFKPNERPTLLEVKTPGKENSKVLKAYFENLKKEV